MAQEELYLCASDIQLESATAPRPGEVTQVKLKQFSRTCNYLQYQKPLTHHHPFFVIQIKSSAPGSVVSIGLAGPGISSDVHPGKWNQSIGYHNNGKCYTSHVLADTGPTFSKGDAFGLMVTHFGNNMSTVLFTKNGSPVSTQYLFQSDRSCFLPTVALENGPIELEILWPDSITTPPKINKTDLSRWIRPPGVTCDERDGLFTSYNKAKPVDRIKCPFSLNKEVQHYEVICHEVSEEGAGPTIGLETCSNLQPPSTHPLQNDFYNYHPNGTTSKVQCGQRMGWGVHYDPRRRDEEDFSDMEEQLVLIYVTLDVTIIYVNLVLQPSGGWFPVVKLHPYASKAVIDLLTNSQPKVLDKLDELFYQYLPSAINDIETYMSQTGINRFHKSSSLEVSVSDRSGQCQVRLSRDRKGVHTMQLMDPLTTHRTYYSIEIISAGDSSVICFGIAESFIPLDYYPGRTNNSVGYHSKEGALYANDGHEGNTRGTPYGKGDTVGVEIEWWGRRRSVALFSKNQCAVGTRYLTQADRSEFLPTVSLCANGMDVVINITWHPHIGSPPLFPISNVNNWCLPEKCKANQEENVVYTEQRLQVEPVVIQSPYPLRDYNHFEVEVLADVRPGVSPPAIALCSASPIHRKHKSNFRNDFLKFQPQDGASDALRKGDLMGWGVMVPSDDSPGGDTNAEDKLVICYLTINRIVILTKVLYQPPGGFYPTVIMSEGVTRVKLNFGATVISDHPFELEAIESLMLDARKLIKQEEGARAKGLAVEDWTKDNKKGTYLKPLPVKTKQISHKHVENNIPENYMKQKIYVETNIKKDAHKKKELLPGTDAAKPDKKAGATVSRTCVLL